MNIAAANRHDLVDFKEHFQELIMWLEKADIPIGGLFLNADAGFDSLECRKLCQKYQIEANIALNTRNSSVNGYFKYFDELLYQSRFVIERAFAWLDAFKAILVRYESQRRTA